MRATPPIHATCVGAGKQAKVVTYVVDGKPIEAVLPAPFEVNLERLLELAGGSEIRVAREIELDTFSPARESGAMPSGLRFSRSVFVDVALASEPVLVFNAVTSPDPIEVRWADLAKSVRPIVGIFAEPSRDCVGAFRLSYRE